jgi:hypothetical protein
MAPPPAQHRRPAPAALLALRPRWAGTMLCAAALLAACTHTVKLEAPKDPIKIDLNVNITQRVVLSLDKEVQDLIKANPNIF